MGRSGPRREGSHVDGVLGPNGAIGLPAVRTLSGEYRETPEPEDPERVPPPAPPSLGRRILDRLSSVRGRSGAGDP
jgi:hypothetical protein